MENGDLYVGSLKQVLIEETKKRIKRVLGCDIVVGPTCNGVVDCFVPTPHAQENLGKTKDYIHAISGGPDVEIVTLTLNAPSIRMIVAHQNDIESTSAAALTTCAATNEVKLQGKLERILLAKTVIDVLLNQSCDQVCLNDNADTSSNSDHGSPSIPNFSAIDPDVFENDDTLDDNSGEYSNFPASKTHGECWQIANFVSRGFDESPGRTADNSANLAHRSPAGNVLQASVAHLDISSHDSSSSDVEESDINEFQKHADYQNKVEFAFKLGYSEAHLCRALQKLGSNAGQNELLSELIKQGSTKTTTPPLDRGATNQASRALSLDDSDDLPVFTYRHRQANFGETTNLHPIVIDGSNVAMSHGNKEVFSCHGILLTVEWFRQRGHRDITVFVPQWRKETSRPDARIKDQDILTQLEKEKMLVFTPARRIGGKRVVCYDDRYVLNLAVETNGIVVSNDNYRDLVTEKAEFKKVVEERLLMYSFVNDRFMPPDDPLGRNGPKLENFLQKEPSQPEPLPPVCPYGRKCTYGNKCKYHHPERKNQPHRSVMEKLAEQAKQRMQELKNRKDNMSDGKKKLSKKQSLLRTKSVNPSELGGHDAQPPAAGLDTSVWGASTQVTTKEEEYQRYNERLAENLRKMEQDQLQKETQSRINEESESQSRMRWTGSPVETLRGSSPRESSPVSSLSVPGQPGYDDAEQFLSGHLLLAKKLSDEANESDKQKQIESANEKERMAQIQQAKLRHPMEEPHENVKQKIPLTSPKQKLSRQLSLQGQEDPRVRQGHATLHAQLSYDPRALTRNQQHLPADPAYRNSLSNDFMYGQSHERLQHQMTPGHEMHNQNVYRHSLGRPQCSAAQELRTHAPLTQMQSAPIPSIRETPARQVPRMMRQNSTSDPQLHKLDYVEPPCAQFGAPVQKDTTGSVAFQIGTSQPLSYTRPARVQYPNYPQFSSQEFEMQSPQAANVQFGNLPQPTAPYVSPQMVMHKPQTFGRTVSASFGPVQDVSSQGQFAYSPHPYSWDNRMPPDITNLAPGSGMPPSQRDVQGTRPEDAPILADDPRYKLYYHLCELFPEAKVRTVMNQHPKAVSPNDICAYIIGAK